VSRPVYANNPNSYLSRVRDNSFTPHYSVSSRRPPGYESSRRRPPSPPSSGNSPQEHDIAAAPRPLLPIGTFVNAERILVWPSEAPITGDLKDKRNTSDEASLVVADLVKEFKAAPITTVTAARQKLLNYGRPALTDVRTHATPRIADTFHMFLL